MAHSVSRFSRSSLWVIEVVSLASFFSASFTLGKDTASAADEEILSGEAVLSQGEGTRLKGSSTGFIEYLNTPAASQPDVSTAGIEFVDLGPSTPQGPNGNDSSIGLKLGIPQ